MDLYENRRSGTGNGCCGEISELKKKVKTLQVDKKVLKEIIREMIYESKHEPKAKEENCCNKSEALDKKSRSTRARSKSRSSMNSFVSREPLEANHRGDRTRDYSQGNAKIIKNPQFAKVVDFEE